ncbi:hypothetical protein WJX74_002807 [Apatococcus lobatus]|uniref:cytidine deaminase n=2 Tax=Apatococcus TaxID=904362 RepID=A0AAW1SH54_9CHLO
MSAEADQTSSVGEIVTRGSLTVDLSRDSGSDKHTFCIEADEVQRLLSSSGQSEDELLCGLIQQASSLARPPISSFLVGAVALGVSGRIFFGVNLEFARLPLYNSVHAEQFLVVNALHHGERELRKLAVSEAPCGHCRQFYSELSCADSIRISFGKGQKLSSYTLAELLPQRFGPGDLLDISNTPLLLQPQQNSLQLTEEAHDRVEARAGDATFQEAFRQAAAQARASYAPYSQCPAGLAVITAKQDVYAGPYIESAAFNPSLSPLQAAIIVGVIDSMPCYTHVNEVVLVELEGGAVQHELTARVVLAQIAPEATLTVLPALSPKKKPPHHEMP